MLQSDTFGEFAKKNHVASALSIKHVFLSQQQLVRQAQTTPGSVLLLLPGVTTALELDPYEVSLLIVGLGGAPNTNHHSMAPNIKHLNLTLLTAVRYIHTVSGNAVTKNCIFT
jgi:hypothetical protein